MPRRRPKKWVKHHVSLFWLFVQQELRPILSSPLPIIFRGEDLPPHTSHFVKWFS